MFYFLIEFYLYTYYLFTSALHIVVTDVYVYK